MRRPKTPTEHPSATHSPGLGHNLPNTIRFVAPAELKLHPLDARKFTDRDIKRARRMLEAFGNRLPLLAGNGNIVIGGQILLLAARSLNMPQVPVIDVSDLDPLEERMLSAA